MLTRSIFELGLGAPSKAFSPPRFRSCCVRTAELYHSSMPAPAENLTPADPSDLASALAYALRYYGRKRVRNADEIMAEVVANASRRAFGARGLRRSEKAAADRRGGFRTRFRGLARSSSNGQTEGIDPLLPFKFVPRKGRNAQISAVPGRHSERIISGPLPPFPVGPRTRRERQDRAFPSQAANASVRPFGNISQ